LFSLRRSYAGALNSTSEQTFGMRVNCVYRYWIRSGLYGRAPRFICHHDFSTALIGSPGIGTDSGEYLARGLLLQKKTMKPTTDLTQKGANYV